MNEVSFFMAFLPFTWISNSRIVACLETILTTLICPRKMFCSVWYMMSDTLIALYCVCDKVFQEKSILRFFAFHSYQSSDFCFRWNKSSFSAVSFLCETLNHVESKSHFRKLHFETTWATLESFIYNRVTT